VANNPGWSGRRIVNPLVIALLLVVALAVPPAGAQEKGDDATSMQALRTAMKGDKRAYIASVLSLTSGEAKRFWPIYDSYQRIINDTSERRVVALKDLIVRDSPTTSLAAKSLALELTNIHDIVGFQRYVGDDPTMDKVTVVQQTQITGITPADVDPALLAVPDNADPAAGGGDR